MVVDGAWSLIQGHILLGRDLSSMQVANLEENARLSRGSLRLGGVICTLSVSPGSNQPIVSDALLIVSVSCRGRPW